MTILLFLIGIFIGTGFGVACMCLNIIASESDNVKFFNDVNCDVDDDALGETE